MVYRPSSTASAVPRRRALNELLGEAWRAIQARKRQAFWFWIAYQTIKGTATTAIIWAPMIAYWVGI